MPLHSRRQASPAAVHDETGSRLPFKPVFCVSVALLMAGCAVQPQRVAQGHSGFSPKVYGRASPRVVADGEPVPAGGGRYQVGKPYTIAGKTYYPSERTYAATGMASWYGDDFHGRRTANGEIFDKASISAAHPTMPLPSYARVTNLRNNASIIVRVNDRGPYHGGRVMDVSQRVAEALDFKNAGTARVKVEYVAKASLGGSDYSRLMATLRRDGSPASLDGSGFAPPTMVAERAPAPAPVAARPPVQPTRQEMAALDERVDEVQTTASTAAVATAEPAGRPAAPPARAPLPPLRPFDLGTIPGAAVPIAAAAPQKQAALVLRYDSSPVSLSDHFVQRGPFEGLKPEVLHPLNSYPE